MNPDKEADALLARIIGQLAQLIVAESPQEAFEDVVFEPELAGPATPVLDLIERDRPTHAARRRPACRQRRWLCRTSICAGIAADVIHVVQISPHSPARLHPI